MPAQVRHLTGSVSVSLDLKLPAWWSHQEAIEFAKRQLEQAYNNLTAETVFTADVRVGSGGWVSGVKEQEV